MRSFARSFLVLVTLAGTALAAPAAHAADACFNIAGSTLVLKAFALPGKGVCKDARGWLDTGSSPWWLDGSACGSTDGTQVTFALMATLDDAVENLLIKLNRATLSGTLRQCVVDTGLTGGCVAGIAIAKVACSPATVPVP